MIAPPPTTGPDPRRWITLAIIVTSALIAALDTTVLNVAIPTILREFDTSLSSLQWVITGYSLTFAALLILGGRLGDIFGARRMFIIGAFLFGVGSLLASLSTGVGTLVLGEAIIEGIGASLMLPASLGILSSTFSGRERATAFGAWGATVGAAVAFGPLLGGFLTTNYSWRWAFRINVIVVPFAIAGALLFMRRTERPAQRERIDVRGALLISSGMLLLVFGISEGGTFGWTRPLRDFVVGGWTVWPDDRAVSVVPIAFACSFVLLCAFYRVQRAKERDDAGPLFEFSTLRNLGFRYGLATLVLLAMGQIAFLFVLSVVLQDSRHLSAVQTGLWLMPSGVFIVAGSQIGGRLTRAIGTTRVVQVGMVMAASGLAAIAMVVTPDLTLLRLLPGFALFGLGIGFATSQLTNVTLSSIAPERAGAASGANTTVRMIGSALGVSIITALFSSQTIRHAVDAVNGSASLSPALRTSAINQIRANGVNFSPPTGTSPDDLATLRRLLESAVTRGARPPLLFATAVVTCGLLLSLRIPMIVHPGDQPEGTEDDVLDELAQFADLDPEMPLPSSAEVGTGGRHAARTGLVDDDAQGLVDRDPAIVEAQR